MAASPNRMRGQSMDSAKAESTEHGSSRYDAKAQLPNLLTGQMLDPTGTLPNKDKLSKKQSQAIMEELYEASNLIHTQVMKLIELVDDENKRKIRELVVKGYREIRYQAQQKRKRSLESNSDIVMGREREEREERVDFVKELKELQSEISLAAEISALNDVQSPDEEKCRALSKGFISEQLEQMRGVGRQALDFTRKSILSPRLQWFDDFLETLKPFEVEEIELYDTLSKSKIPVLLIEANKEMFGTIRELLYLIKAIALHDSHDMAESARSLTKEVLNSEYLDSERRMHTPLRRAVELNNFEMVQALCQQGADPSQVSNLSSAIRYAHELSTRADKAFEALATFPQCLFAPDITAEIIDRLAGTNLDYADESQQTPLHFHARAKHVDIVQALVKNGASIDKEDMHGKTPLDLAIEVEAPTQLTDCLDHVVLSIGLGGQTLPVPTGLLIESQDVVHDLKMYVRKYLKDQEKRVSYYSMRIIIGGEVVPNLSWAALNKPKELSITLGCNFRDDAEKSREFLQLSEQIADLSDHAVRGHLEEYQNPDVTDEAGETAAWKAARNDDVQKLKYLEMANANLDQRSFGIENADLDHGDRGGATALFIASQHGRLNAVRFLVDKVKVDIPLNTNASPLYVACQNGHTQVVEVLLKAGANPNLQTDDKATPLFIAAQMGHCAIVEMLLAAGADVELANTTNASPLFIASQHDHAAIVKVLLDANACVNSQTTSGASPTYIAAQQGSMRALELLLDAGADPNLSGNDGATPMLIAAQHGRRDAVRLLVKRGANIRKGMLSGATSLFVAAQNGHLEVVLDLVIADSQSDEGKQGEKLVDMCLQNGTSPLYAAAQNGHMETVKYLSKVKADLNLKSVGGVSPLFIAAQKGHLSICLFLLEADRRSKGGQLKQVTDDGSSPLLVAAQNGHISIVKAFIKEMRLHLSAEEMIEVINRGKEGGATALYLAAQNGHFEVVERLIHCNASVDKPLDTKETPLFIACQGGHKEVVQLLLGAGADVNLGKLDKTPPLYIACQNHHTHLIEMLLKAKADLNAINESRATAIFISAQKGFTDIVSILLEWGADPELAIRTGARPIYIAAMKGHLQVVRKLLDHGVDANAAPEHQTTPLLIAIRNGHEEVADLLLEAKVDVNQGDCDGKTPLRESMKVNDRLVLKLIAAGAEQNDFHIFYHGLRMIQALSPESDGEVGESMERLLWRLEDVERNFMKIHHAWHELMLDLGSGRWPEPKSKWFLQSQGEIQRRIEACGQLMQELCENLMPRTEPQNTSASSGTLFSPLWLVTDTIKQCSQDLIDLGGCQSWPEDEDRPSEVSRDFFEAFLGTWLNLTQASSLIAVFKKFLKQAPSRTPWTSRTSLSEQPETPLDISQEIRTLHTFENRLKRFLREAAEPATHNRVSTAI